jgi:flagellar motor protein MotB
MMKTFILSQRYCMDMRSAALLKRYGLKMKPSSRSFKASHNHQVPDIAGFSKRIAVLVSFCLVLLLVVRSVLAQTDQHEGIPISSTAIISFSDGSARFVPSSGSSTLLEGARTAALISIRGRTSTNTATAKDEALALARAIAARSYLIAHGVSPLKISLNYASATDFIADNATVDGRQQNQRVEIDIIQVPNGHEG